MSPYYSRTKKHLPNRGNTEVGQRGSGHFYEKAGLCQVSGSEILRLVEHSLCDGQARRRPLCGFQIRVEWCFGATERDRLRRVEAYPPSGLHLQSSTGTRRITAVPTGCRSPAGPLDRSSGMKTALLESRGWR